ncbi:hypothetical protein DCC62_18230 [candidate division KSB1 bacterium]|nr:MAG: hypothetical protein DCC62_18230 [candidate division KSB1 bacterium]
MVKFMERTKKTIFIWAPYLTIIIASWQYGVSAQALEVGVGLRTVDAATIKDSVDIRFFADQYFISETIDSLEIFDIRGDGFNETDVMQIYPSKRLINLSQSDTALAVMRSWKRRGAIDVVGERNKKTGKIEATSNLKTALTMFASIVRMVESIYQGPRLKLYFDFDGEEGSAALKIWGYENLQEMAKEPKDWKQFAHDLVFYTRTDTLYVDKPVYDVIYIEQTVTDTVYVNKGRE